MTVQDFFKAYDVFFNSIREITVTHTLDGYQLKISCQKGGYRVLICEDHWVEDDFKVITVVQKILRLCMVSQSNHNCYSFTLVR